MGQLHKATLWEITSDERAEPVGAEIAVQLNPTSLRLQLSNQVEGGRSRGRQARQYLGTSSTVLSMELVFDTADEGTSEQPRSVLDKTRQLERFVLPQQDGKETPPKLRFHWGNLIFDGVVDSLTVDLDLFAASGVPLRAKVGLSIKGQDPEYQFLQSGPGANAGGNAPEPGSPGAGPGLQGGSTLSGPQLAVSLGGETAGWSCRAARWDTF